VGSASREPAGRRLAGKLGGISIYGEAKVFFVRCVRHIWHFSVHRDRPSCANRIFLRRQVWRFFPWLAGPKPCSIWEYVAGNMLLFAVLLGATYWPLVLALLFLPPIVGYLFDRRA